MPRPVKLNIDPMFRSNKPIRDRKITIKKGILSDPRLNRKLFYTEKARKRILEFKNLQRTFYEETKKPGFTFYEDPKDRFRIIKLGTKQETIREFYTLELNTQHGVEKYFIKEQRLAKDNPLLKADANALLKNAHNAFNQARAMEILRKFNVNVIDVEYAFVNKDRSFLVAKYKENLLTVDQAKEMRIISEETKQWIEDKLSDFNYEINSYFKKYVSTNRRVISDIGTHNTFINPKKGELYIFDIMIDKKT
jgi:hypothetical protein